MQISSKSDFRTCALSSGLVTKDQLAEATAALTVDVALDRSSRQRGESDRRLAQQLVEMGAVTEFQAEQLLSGRSNFRLGQYLVVDSLGQGGMGQVFKAEHSLMGRVVAVKVLPKHRTNPDSEARFVREIQAQSGLDHENLVRALDAGKSGNVHYLVTEFIPGQDLRKIVRRKGRLGMRALATIITQVAHGLDHAHAKGMIHRDVKPGNVLVTDDGRVKLADLGLVGFFDEEIDELSIGKIVGTADYLAPEQISSPERVGPASDIYSLGCTLYYVATGKVPFPGGTTKDKCRKHMDENCPPLDPRRLNPGLSDLFVDCMADMMEKDPANRIQSASEVIDRLAVWYDESWRLDDEEDVAENQPPQITPRRLNSVLPVPGEDSLSDTAEPSFIADPVDEPEAKDPSDASQRTHPVASALDETSPMEAEVEVPRRPSIWQRIDGTKVVLALGILLALAVPFTVLLYIISAINR